MNQIQEYSETEAGLAILRSKLKDAVYDVATTPGLELAKKDRRECVTLRTTLEAKRKEIKAPALAHCQKIDAEAKRITAEIELLELPINAQIKQEEDRKEAIRKKKEEAEQFRVNTIKERITVITGLHLKLVSVPNSLSMREIIQTVREQVTATEAEFQEWQPMAQMAIDETLRQMEIIVADKEAAEIEEIRKAEEHADQQRKIAEEQEALRLAREAFEKEQEAVRIEAKRVADEWQAEQEAKAAAQKIENDRVAAEQKAAQDAIAAERAALDEQRRIEDDKRKVAEAADLEEKRIERERLAAEAQAKIDEQRRIDEEKRVEMVKKAEAEFVERMKAPYAALEKIREIVENKELSIVALRNQIIIVTDIALEQGRAA